MITTIILNDTDTGFTGMTPSSDDIKRYFNGWKYVDGTDWEPIGYTGDSVDGAAALSNLVIDIYPDAEWRPYTYLYKLDEEQEETVYANGVFESYNGTNIITSNDSLSMYIDVDSNQEVVSKVIDIIDIMKSRIMGLKSRVEALE